MKRLFVLLIFLFLLSGCEITYNLEISNDSLNESTTIVEKDLNRYYSDEPSQRFYNNYTMVPIPALQTEPIPTPTRIGDFTDYKLKDVDYYAYKNISNESQIGVSYKWKFNYNSFSNSRMMIQAAPNCSFNYKDNNLTIETGALDRLFNQFPTLDQIVVNMKIKNYNVIENNADEVNNNIYTWIINNSNYMEKPINISLEKKKTVQEKIRDTENMPMIMIVLFLIALGVIIYVVIKVLDKKNSRF